MKSIHLLWIRPTCFVRSKQAQSQAEDGSEHSVSLPACGLLLPEAVLAQQWLGEGMRLAVRLFYSPCHAKSRKVLSKTWCVGEATGVGAFIVSVPPGLAFPQSFWKLPGYCALESVGEGCTARFGWAYQNSCTRLSVRIVTSPICRLSVCQTSKKPKEWKQHGCEGMAGQLLSTAVLQPGWKSSLVLHWTETIFSLLLSILCEYTTQ